MDYILSGKSDTVKKILQENAIRVRRGEIKFIPVTEASYNVLIADDKYVAAPVDDKDSPMPADKKRPRKAKSDKDAD